MKAHSWHTIVGLLFLLVAACAPAAPSGSQTGTSVQPVQKKRIVAGMMSNPPCICSQSVTSGSGTIQGGDALEDLLNGGLSVVDNTGHAVPQLAEAVPSVENGLWKLFPDGRMETTWRLRPGISWHDGAPFTIDDLLFTVKLGRDKDLAIFNHTAMGLVEDITPGDAGLVNVRWKQPYIQADTLFTRRVGLPRPQHVLGPIYADNPESVLTAPYWTESYVGTGPFVVRQWVSGSYLILAPNDRFPLGRPKLDEIEVRFIPDSTTLAANILAGEIELSLGRNLSLTQATEIRDRWQNGVIKIALNNWFAAWPQFVNPDPPIILDVRFRRALFYALDRDQLVETLEAGLTPVAHTFLSPTEPMYRQVEADIVRYPHDTRQAAQLLGQIGFTQGSDGAFRDAGGRSLGFEVRTDGGGGDDEQEKTALAVANQWKRFGIATEPLVISQARRLDREYNSTYPAIRVWRLPNDPWSLDRYASPAAPMPGNRFNGGNRSRYMNPEFDALINRYMSTIAEDQRTGLLGQIIHHMTDQVTVMGLWYNTEPISIGNRLRNVTTRDAGGTTEAWNAHLWDVA